MDYRSNTMVDVNRNLRYKCLECDEIFLTHQRATAHITGKRRFDQGHTGDRSELIEAIHVSMIEDTQTPTQPEETPAKTTNEQSEPQKLESDNMVLEPNDPRIPEAETKERECPDCGTELEDISEVPKERREFSDSEFYCPDCLNEYIDE
jgi:predicted RNA-binding Zn-ribbon protein involved in translation (DUF1610 family)